MANELPSADEFFGPAGSSPPADKPLPNADEFFGMEAPKEPGLASLTYRLGLPDAVVKSSAAVDHFLQWPGSATGRILNAFDQGGNAAWGTEPIGLSKEATDTLTKAGWLNDYKAGRTSFIKGFNEAWMRPAASALDAAMRMPGALFQGGQYAIEQAGSELGVPHLGHELAGFPEAFMGMPHPTGIPPISAIELQRARAWRVIGGGEGGWKGTVDAKALTPEQQAEVAKAQVEDHQAAPQPSGQSEEPAMEPGTPAAQAPSQEPPPDIHSVAREIAPEAFQKYDALQTRQDTFRRWIDELGVGRANNPKVVAANEEIATILGKVSGVEDRLTNKQAARIDELRGQVSDYLSTDTADMKTVRDALQKNDYELRDVAPDVAAAYRQAQERMPVAEDATPAVSHETPPPAVEAAQTPEAAPAAQAEPVAEAQPQPASNAPANENAVTDIAGDVSKKLVAAGRPQEEADAAAQLVQSHYEARAARFAGAKGTAADLYNAEAPEIVGAEKGGRAGQAGGKTVVKNARATITLFGKADASTFIHETGHQWLEELLRDAADERATAETKADAAKVREWAGAPKEGDIPTRAHEKFARGFERYMMEGVAPSKALARVFEQFRQWLTSIYQTVQKLRSPITDDIRGVFDRLITAKPEKAIIAPERKPTQSIHDLHEEDAERTPPPHADQVGDIVASETNAVAKEKAPDVHPELTGRSQGEAGRGAAQNARPTGGADATGPDPGAPGNAPQPGTVNTGGDQAAQEGAGVRTAERTGEQPAGPNSRLPEPDSKYIDKAGNIRLDNLNTTADVDELIREISDENDGFIGARRGVVSDQQVLDLADAMGVQPKDLDINRLRSEFSPEKVMAVRKLFVQTANDAHELSRQAATGSDMDVLAYMQARARMKMVQGYLAGLTAETGRALRAFRKIEGIDRAKDIGQLMDEMSETRTLFQMRQEAARVAKLDTTGKVAGFLKDADKPGLGAMALEVFTNWLISGPLTHLGYSVGNTMLALWKAVPETLGEVAVGAAKRAITGQDVERVRFGEAGAQLYGMIRGQRNGVQAAYDSFKSGQTMPLPGEGVGTAKTPFTPRQAIPNLSVAGVPVPLGSAVRVPGERMVAPIHSYFRTIGYSQSIAGQAYRQASAEGARGNAFSARVAELTAHPTEQMMEQAREEATQQTLMGKGGSLTQRVSQFVNWEPNIPGLGPTRLLRFIDPFVHIASNIVEQSVIERGPLGVLSTKIREDMSGKNGPIAQDRAIARMAVGTALSVVGGGLAAEGLITPSAPSNPNEAAMWRRLNGLPHSARVGETSYDLSRLGPLGFQLGIAADLYHVADSIGKDDITKVGSLLVHSFAQNFLDEGFMRGPSDLIKALDDPDRYGQRYFQNFASSFAVPYSVGMSQVAREIDPYAREARSLVDQMKAKTPFLSETLFPMVDIWGETVPNRDWALTYQTQVSNDPVDKALYGLGVYPSKPERKIRGVELSDQQYHDYAQLAGRTAKLRLNAIVRRPGFDALPVATRVEMIRETIETARENARAVIMMRDSRDAAATGRPSIIQQATAEKIQQLRPTVH